MTTSPPAGKKKTSFSLLDWVAILILLLGVLYTGWATRQILSAPAEELSSAPISKEEQEALPKLQLNTVHGRQGPQVEVEGSESTNERENPFVAP